MQTHDRAEHIGNGRHAPWHGRFRLALVILLAGTGFCVAALLAGRQGSVHANAAPGVAHAGRTCQPWILVAGGLAVTALVAGYAVNHARHAARIEQLVAQRTDELRQSEEATRMILDSVQAGVAVIDAQTKTIVDVNRAAEAMIAAPKEQLVGRRCLEVLCYCQEPGCSRTEHCQVPAGAECSLRTATGGAVPVFKTVVPVTLRGRPHLLETFVDITQRKDAEEARRVGEEKLRAISDCAIDALVMIDPLGRVIHWNPAAERMFGYTADEILGRDVHEILATKEDQVKHARGFPQFVREGTGVAVGRIVQLEAVRKNGSMIPVEISISSIRLNGRWWAVAVIRDLTERRQAERQLRRHTRALEMANEALELSCREAQAANRTKGEFLANMSHELRTPLHGILSFASFGIKKGRTVPTESLLEYFQLIRDSGKSLLNLVNDLLDLAKLEAGKMHLELEPVDLDELVAKTADEFRSQVSERSIKIECRGPTDGAIVIADAGRIQQVLRNLLSNAIKYSSDGSRVVIMVARDSKAVSVAVRDYGVGIPPEELSAVFDKFVQSSKTRSGAGGTGLGLAICREIVTAHRGRIWAANAPDGGAILTFTLPEDLRVEEPIGAVCPTPVVVLPPDPETATTAADPGAA